MSQAFHAAGSGGPRLRIAYPEAIRFSPATAGRAAEVCVVAEIGVNHDGDVARALQLVDAAAFAGADAVKLQLFNPRHLLSNQAQLAEYQKASDSSVFDMLDRLKLSPEAMVTIRRAAHRLGLGFVVTPFSLEQIEDLDQLDVDAVKIASPDVVNLPLLKAAAELGLPMIVSTGTSDLEEIAGATGIISDRPCCLLHCISSYPAPAAAASLYAMQAMRDRFGLPVGYSDHTTELLTGALAVAAGACVIEKHLTYDRRAAGPDHAASFDAQQFRQYVRLIRQAESMTGPVCKVVEASEQEVRRISRQSVCAVRDLPAGHVLRREDLTVKRPGTGVAAARLEEVFGRPLVRAVKANDLLVDGDVDWAEAQGAG